MKKSKKKAHSLRNEVIGAAAVALIATKAMGLPGVVIEGIVLKRMSSKIMGEFVRQHHGRARRVHPDGTID